MSERITNAFLQARVDTVNRLLGTPEDAAWNAIGNVVLYGAYGATGVHRIVNEHGGVTALCQLGTKREVSLFLAGMIEALRIVENRD